MTYHIRTQAGALGVLLSLFLLATTVTVQAGPPSDGSPTIWDLGATNVTFKGLVNCGGLPTTAYFAYVTDGHGFTTPSQDIGSNGSVTITATVTNLIPGTHCNVHIIAYNSAGYDDGYRINFDSKALAPVVTASNATVAGVNSYYLNAQVNPGGGNTAGYFEYGLSLGAYGPRTNFNAGKGLTNVNISALLSGLNYNTTYWYRAVATNSSGTTIGADKYFTVAAQPPVISNYTASATATSITVTCYIEPRGSSIPVTVDYGTSTNYSTGSVYLGSTGGNKQPGYIVTLSTNITGLTPGTQYYYRITSSASTQPTDAISTLPAVPTAATLAPTFVSSQNATLAGQVNSYGAQTTAWFQYGTDTNYGSSSAITLLSSQTQLYSVSKSATGLQSSTTYHYRLIATNSVGSATGTDFIFTTPAAFTNTPSAIPALTSGSAAWADYDRDSNLDLLITGYDGTQPVSRLFRNLGNGTFSNLNLSLPGLVNSSVAWADYDNDGYLDFLIAGNTLTNYVTQLWHNQGNGSFVRITTTAFTGVGYGQVAWGDSNNDGKPDVLLNGYNGTNYVTELWQNLGNGVFTNINAGLPGTRDGSVAWGDYDNDGRLDILLAGQINGVGTCSIYRNTGNGFTNLNAGLTGLWPAYVAWGDYDNDGRLDLVLAGGSATMANGNATNPVCQVWRNTGSGFTNLNAGLPGFLYGSVGWGDYDNDGKLDLLICGSTNNASAGAFTRILRNTGSGFVAANVGLPGAWQGSSAWADYDNDGRLDLLINGYNTNSALITQLWRNNNGSLNSLPVAPPALKATITNLNSVLLSWNAASDAQTLPNGLTYNLRLGSTPGGSQIIAPQASPASGLRWLPQMGNAQTDTNALVTGLDFGTYYWSVQAIDGAFAGGPFAAEQSFTVLPPAPVINSFLITNNLVSLSFNGPTNASYSLLGSTNLVDWTSLGATTQSPPGTFHFTAPYSLANPALYYRVTSP